MGIVCCHCFSLSASRDRLKGSTANLHLLVKSYHEVATPGKHLHSPIKRDDRIFTPAADGHELFVTLGASKDRPYAVHHH